MFRRTWREKKVRLSSLKNYLGKKIIKHVFMVAVRLSTVLVWYKILNIYFMNHVIKTISNERKRLTEDVIMIFVINQFVTTVRNQDISHSLMVNLNIIMYSVKWLLRTWNATRNTVESYYYQKCRPPDLNCTHSKALRHNIAGSVLSSGGSTEKWTLREKTARLF